MLTLTLLAHASTAAMRRAAFPLDEPLEARGLHKAEALAASLKPVRRVLTSPALRARQTADALGLTAEMDERLREIDYGMWSGLTLKDVEAREPEAVARWLSDPEAAPHGGESLAALFERAGGFLSDQAMAGSDVLAVTHASVIRAAVVLALGAPAVAFWRIDIEPLGQLVLQGGISPNPCLPQSLERPAPDQVGTRLFLASPGRIIWRLRSILNPKAGSRVRRRDK